MTLKIELNPEKTTEYFETIWKLYPVKDGKKSAWRAFKYTVKTEQDWQDIQKALSNYLKSKFVLKGFIKLGSTWFNNWQDWIDFTNPGMTPEQEADRERLKADLKQAYSELKTKEGYLNDMGEEDQRRGKYLGEVDRLKKKIEVIEKRLQ